MVEYCPFQLLPWRAFALQKHLVGLFESVNSPVSPDFSSTSNKHFYQTRLTTEVTIVLQKV